jgi:hypothetical protein
MYPVRAAWWLAQRLMNRYIICVIFHGICSVKEAKLSVTLVSGSALVYSNTLSLLSFIIPHRLRHFLNFIHPLAHQLSVTHPNACSSIAYICH